MSAFVLTNTKILSFSPEMRWVQRCWDSSGRAFFMKTRPVRVGLVGFIGKVFRIHMEDCACQMLTIWTFSFIKTDCLLVY